MSPLEKELAHTAEARRLMLQDSPPAVSQDRKVIEEAAVRRAAAPKIARRDDHAFLQNLDRIARGEVVIEGH